MAGPLAERGAERLSGRPWVRLSEPAGAPLAPVSRGGKPVCWLRIRPWRGSPAFLPTRLAAETGPGLGVLFLRRALW